ncbi:hypothetical protein IT409_01970 [Candidatus Falkowbacteria bacterium]|nr:hypothetical protein [Candidatus Falkowbacteria bacterium]
MGIPAWIIIIGFGLIITFGVVNSYFSQESKNKRRTKKIQGMMDVLSDLVSEIEDDYLSDTPNLVLRTKLIDKATFQIKRIAKFCDVFEMFKSDFVCDCVDVYLLYAGHEINSKSVELAEDVFNKIIPQEKLNEWLSEKETVRAWIKGNFLDWISFGRQKQPLSNEVIFELLCNYNVSDSARFTGGDVFVILDEGVAFDKEWRRAILNELMKKEFLPSAWQRWDISLIEHHPELYQDYTDYIFSIEGDWSRKIDHIKYAIRNELVREYGLLETKYVMFCIQHSRPDVARQLIELGAPVDSQLYDLSERVFPFLGILTEKDIYPTAKQFENVFQVFANKGTNSTPAPDITQEVRQMFMLVKCTKEEITENSFESLAKSWKRDNVAKLYMLHELRIAYSDLWVTLCEKRMPDVQIMEIFARHGCEDLVSQLQEMGVEVNNDVILAATWYAAEQAAQK